MSDFVNPLPELTSVSKPFYAAARERKLLIQHCTRCKQNICYPKVICPNCLSSDLGWFESCGRGKVYSYTVVHSAAPEAFIQAIPYVIGVIDLEEGVRMLSWIVECAPDRLVCDMDVEVTFRDLDENVALPVFKPARTFS